MGAEFARIAQAAEVDEEDGPPLLLQFCLDHTQQCGLANSRSA